MDKGGKHIIILVIALFFLTSFTTEMRFRKYDMGKGLSHNSVLCVAKDHDGFIWIGTRDGLNRFDGTTFIHFNHLYGDSTSLSNNQINCIYLAKNGDLWIGTSNGLNLLKKGEKSFQRFFFDDRNEGLISNYIRCVTEIHSGDIIVGTSSGLNILDPLTGGFKHVEIPKTGLRSGSVIKILEDKNLNLWVGTRYGLYHWDLKTFTRYMLDESLETTRQEFEIRDISEDNSGYFWVATEQYGLYRFRPDMGKSAEIASFHDGNSDILSNQIRKIFLKDDRTIWLGTIDGLSIFDLETAKFNNIHIDTETQFGLSRNSIRDIFTDDQGGIWLGTYAGGLFYYHHKNNLFRQFRLISGDLGSPAANAVAAILEDDYQNLWIATEGGGLHFYGSTGQSTIYTSKGDDISLVHNNVKTLVSDKKGNIWIGTVNGLSFFDRAANKFKNYRNIPGDFNSLINNQVHTLYMDDQGILWIGTNGGGVQLFDVLNEKFSPLTDISERNINVMLPSSNKRLWIGSQGGLECFDLQLGKKLDITSFFSHFPVSVEFVQCIFEDQAGVIWVGTMGYGLFAIKENKVYWFSNVNGLPDNTVNAILQDNSGRYWLSTNRGLSKVEFSAKPDSIELMNSRTYTESHGLQGQQFYPGSALKSRSGSFYFGGNNGVNQFIPEEIDDSDIYPNILITSVFIPSPSGSSHSVPTSDPVNNINEIILPYRQRSISIGFTGINYISPDQTVFRYKLMNQSDNWVDIGNQRTINFNFLPAGKYELRLQASTSPENWSNEYKSVLIKILSPWYTTIWAFLLYFIIIGILLLVFFYYSQKWAQLKNELVMEHFQREKEKELHQIKLRFFTDVSHELRTPLTLILAPIERIIEQSDLTNKLRNQLMQIQRNGRRMMQLINKILDLRRLETGHGQLNASETDLVEFLNETSLAFEDTANLKSIEFTLQTVLSSLVMYFDRDKLEIILYNLLSNALRNTPAGGKIVLNLHVEDSSKIESLTTAKPVSEKYAVLRVIDNGKGIPADLLEKIFERFYSAERFSGKGAISSGVGLELTKRMVELHHGVIHLESKLKSEQEEGFTCFTVFLPIGKDHLSENEIQSEYHSAEDISQYLRDELQESEISDKLKAGEILQPEAQKDEINDKSFLFIIDDNTEVRSFIRSIFEGEFNVEEIESGDTGLGRALKVVPDLIICDVMMPGMNGVEFCRRIKTDIHTCHIPVILLTAQTALTFKYEGLETGADDYITKPFSANYLLARVRNLIRQRELMRQHIHREAISDPGKITVTSLDEKLLKKAVDYINNNISDSTLSVEKLSIEIGLSRVHFYRKIKALTNQTAVEFIRNVRLKRAAWLLQQNKFNINEVRQMVGFEDEEYFRKCFIEQYGKTPSEYQKTFQKN